MIARQTVDVVFSLEGDSTDYDAGKLDAVPSGGWKPKATNGRKCEAPINSVSRNAPDGEYATLSIQMTGVGALEKVGAITAPTAKTMSASQTTAQTAKA